MNPGLVGNDSILLPKNLPIKYDKHGAKATWIFRKAL